MHKSFVVVLASALALACVEQQPELTEDQRHAIEGLVTREAPHPQHEIGVQFENRIELLGYDISTETIAPGQSFTITWYWHAQRRLDAGWQIFTHLADGRGENRVNEDSTGPIRQNYQPGRWQAGEYITDRQEITLPSDWNSDRVTFFLGLWNGPHRLEISHGPSDEENRARAASITVSGGPAAEAAPPPRRAPEAAAVVVQTPVPSIRAVRASAITVDGNLDEPIWQSATRTAQLVSTVDGSAAPLHSTARFAWDDRNLYVGFDVDNDTYLHNTLTGRDAHLWEQDAVEIMIDPDGDEQNYYELQVSPTSQVFDTRYDSRRVPAPIGHADWNARIEARAATRGTPNDETADEGWTAEIAIAWSSFTTPEGRRMSAPPEGATWRINLYVMDTTQSGQRSAGWSPTYERDFHVPARFGRVQFTAPAEATTVAVRPGARGGLVGTPQLELTGAAGAALRRDLAASSPGRRAVEGTVPRLDQGAAAHP